LSAAAAEQTKTEKNRRHIPKSFGSSDISFPENPPLSDPSFGWFSFSAHLYLSYFNSGNGTDQNFDGSTRHF
jgi:hypothetical protein